MSRKWDEGIGTFTDDPDDLEIGALAYSKSHHRGAFPRGGTVIGINLDVDDAVLSVVVLEQPGPGVIDTFEIDRSDVDMDLCEWYARNAQVAADIITRWLGKNPKADRRVKARWIGVAGLLADAAASGQFLPGAELRFRRHEAARHAS